MFRINYTESKLYYFFIYKVFSRKSLRFSKVIMDHLSGIDGNTQQQTPPVWFQTSVNELRQLFTSEMRHMRNGIAAQIEELKGAMDANNKKMDELKLENAILRKRLCDCEKIRSENGLLLFQLAETTRREDVLQTVAAKLQTAGVMTDEHTDAYRVGKKVANNTRPIIVRFLSRKQCENAVKKLINFNKVADRDKSERINFKREVPFAYVEIERKHKDNIREARAAKKIVNWRNHCLYIDGIPIESACTEDVPRRTQSMGLAGRKRGRSITTRAAAKRGNSASSSQ